MKKRIENLLHGRLKFLQLSMFILFTTSAHSLSAKEINTHIERRPASAPEEEVMTAPSFDKPLLLTVFADDDGGVMAGMRNSINDWEAKEEYAKNWNLTSTGLFTTPTTDKKKQYISSNLLRYADKRLAGEVRNAEEGSTLHTVGKVEKSLRPNAEVAFSRLITLKFKARVLQGKAIMEVRNPWVDCSTTVSAKGKVKVLTKKDFKDIGTSSGVEYTANDSSWIAFVDQQVSENIKARVSSTQNNKSMFSNDADKKLEMTASFPLDM